MVSEERARHRTRIEWQPLVDFARDADRGPSGEAENEPSATLWR